MPIIDIAAVLGLGATPEPQRIAVVEDGEARAGLAVEEVLDVGLIGEVTGAGDSPFLSGSTLRDGTLVGVIDLSAVLSSLTATATEG
jgi:chemotaxis signal transduction protein